LSTIFFVLQMSFSPQDEKFEKKNSICFDICVDSPNTRESVNAELYNRTRLDTRSNCLFFGTPRVTLDPPTRLSSRQTRPVPVRPFFALLPLRLVRQRQKKNGPGRTGNNRTHSRNSSRSSCRSFARRRSAAVPRSDRCLARPAASCGPDGTARSCTPRPPAAPCR